jgi:alkylhydroperoxidase/carboxymuconolactone decarboxylase family protein YurZ
VTANYEEAIEFRQKVLGPYGFSQAIHDPDAREFVGDYHNMVVTTAWGTIWNRGGLSLRERRLITMAILMARQQTPEFQMHLRAALFDGMTAEDIRELIIHTAAYLGFASATTNFGHAWPVVKEHLEKGQASEPGSNS